MTAEKLALILLLALCTYIMRISGVWFVRRFQMTPELEKTLGQLPGIVLAAVLAPALMDMGMTGLPALVVTGVIAARGGGLVLSVISGALVFFLVRHFA